MQSLGTRLQTVLRSVPENSAVADIGTDHAFLPIALIKLGIAKKVIACDINEKPLEVAKKNIEKTGVKNIEVRLSNGLQNVNKDEVDVITIAGMGGDLICNIIKEATWLKDKSKRLIMQPMTSADVIREYLYSEGFEILDEIAVVDTGRVYSVITASFSGEKRKITSGKKFIGELKYTSADNKRYIDLQYNRVKSCAESLKNVKQKEDEYKLFSDAEKEIKEIIEKK